MSKQVKIFFFDTETTGLLHTKPYVVQLGGIFGTYETDGTIISEEKIDLLFNSPIPIPQVCIDVHGITNDMVKDKPFFTEYLDEFRKIADAADIIVCHNVGYDKPVVFGEIDRKRKADSEEKERWKFVFSDKCVCTMATPSVVDFVKARNKNGGIKRPKLEELHVKLFGENFDNAHNAFADIEATRNCFFELHKRGILSTLTD